MRVSEFFGLNVRQSELDFVDVNTATDVELYVDPCWIHTINIPWFRRATTTIEDFFNHILGLYENGDYEDAKELFHYAHEPNEICFGLSTNAPEGTGASADMLSKVFDNILEAQMFDNGLIERLEDIHVFVEDFGQDRLSDLVVNIIRMHLVEYTEEQCKKYNIEINTDERQLAHYWDPESHSWVECNRSPLVINGKDILLVPKTIAVKNFKYNAGQYCTHFVLSRRKEYHLENNTNLVRRTPNKNGEVIPKVYKKDIREQEIKDRGLSEKQYAREITEQERSLIQQFRARIADILLDEKRTNKLSDEDLEEMLENL
ncbi:hypothetical protein GCM10007216_03740 [Thalassobacillus devorans]|uniref:Uncharacterized protein n=1 Tax=Thalassobacillus devorans TaxID=279813 RepID=A0ABQ1NH97_9BACI|nr:hypothetical protein [Thalassobacillus devorans]NIK27283.1 hypothetical protein [Thalassobacillus devorans]GGC76444.1 hypothetical protein GCM10007216_03740 [Thalassobacillus devorans]